jgi:hypothetical protein
MAKSRLYSIEIKDARTEQVVVFAAADWTEKEKRVAVAQIVRLVGLSDDRRRPRTDVIAPGDCWPQRAPPNGIPTRTVNVALARGSTVP